MALLARDDGRSEVALETLPGTRSQPVAFALLAGVPVLAAAWMLMSTGRVLSHEMTWDFLFNLAGAWHLHHGHVAHVDFHDPVGQLNFLLTAFGFRLVGPTPLAFVVGNLFFALATFVAASLTAWRRLPLLPTVIFVVFASLLVLMPANVGDPPNAYSFAMSYNRYGWSALSILVLILFLPSSRSSHVGDALDIAVAGLLMVALFYLKMTYFAAALAALGLALLFYPHVRERGPAWLAVGGLVVANALAPHSRPYLLDIWNAAEAGQIRGGLGVHLNTFFTAAEGYAAYAAGLVVAVWLWWEGRTPLRLPIAVAFLLVIGMFLLTQNHQTQGVPLGVMIAFLLYDQFRQRPSGGRLAAAVPAFALMVFPLASIGMSSLSLAGYFLNAGRDERLRVVDHTQLKGLAVPAEPPGLLAAFASGTGDHTLLNRARVLRPRHELSPSEYVETLLEAASLFDDGRRRSSGIVVLDQVNPLPFMLGVAPPKGGALWSGWGVPVRPVAEIFADADHVLIPKFSTYSPWTEEAMRAYGAYLSQHFQHREETQSWIVLSRDDANVTPPPPTGKGDFDLQLGQLPDLN